ncbi:hypothetical protein MMC10_008420 [Thelotrema lepadinum]|nr:hypothetical protein [Thelotrema lepadinum]
MADEKQPPSSLSSKQEDRPPPSLLVRRFLNAKPRPDPPSPWQPPPFRKKFFFFYGTLMSPTILGKVLNLEEQPTLQPASIVGYHYKLWGSYPALLDGPRNAKVEGAAYEIQSAEQVKLLQHYETDRYRKAGCRIWLANGLMINGFTFVWRSKDAADQLREGVFDLEAFQKTG